MKTEKAAGPSELVSKIVQSAGEPRISMKANVINYIIVKTAVQEEWQPRSFCGTNFRGISFCNFGYK